VATSIALNANFNAIDENFFIERASKLTVRFAMSPQDCDVHRRL
jgi:hypothetical protein